MEMRTFPNWLITGGCGFIGVNLIAQLLRETADTNIRVLDNLSVGTETDLLKFCGFNSLPSRTELVIGDIRDFDTCLNCCEGMDIVVHLAANTGVAPSVENPRLDMEANVIGTFNMLEAARRKGVKRFVFASSGAPVGECEPPIHEELAPHPVSPYGASKLAGEGYCSAYFRAFGLETVALRFGNVYGPGSAHKSSVVAKFIRKAIKGEPLEIYGDGKQTRDFIYIDDLIQAIRLAASAHGIGCEIFQIATGGETTVEILVNKLVQILSDAGYPNARVRHAGPRVGDVRRNFSDTSKVMKVFGWKAETGLAEGMRRTMEWFIDQYRNNFGDRRLL